MPLLLQLSEDAMHWCPKLQVSHLCICSFLSVSTVHVFDYVCLPVSVCFYCQIVHVFGYVCLPVSAAKWYMFLVMCFCLFLLPNSTGFGYVSLPVFVCFYCQVVYVCGYVCLFLLPNSICMFLVLCICLFPSVSAAK